MSDSPPALFESNLHSLQLHTTYFLEDGGNIRAGYRYETFRADERAFRQILVRDCFLSRLFLTGQI